MFWWWCVKHFLALMLCLCSTLCACVASCLFVFVYCCSYQPKRRCSFFCTIIIWHHQHPGLLLQQKEALFPLSVHSHISHCSSKVLIQTVIHVTGTVNMSVCGFGGCFVVYVCGTGSLSERQMSGDHIEDWITVWISSFKRAEWEMRMTKRICTGALVSLIFLASFNPSLSA